MKKTFRITVTEGLHARPATLLVSAVSPFSSDVELHYNDKIVNLKSIMGVMAQAIPAGAVVTISAHGEDAEEIVSKVTEVMISQAIGEEC